MHPGFFSTGRSFDVFFLNQKLAQKPRVKVPGQPPPIKKKRSELEKKKLKGKEQTVNLSGTSWDALRMPVANEGLYIGIPIYIYIYILKMKAFWVVIGMLGTSFVSQGPKVSAKNVVIFGGHKLAPGCSNKMCC